MAFSSSYEQEYWDALGGRSSHPTIQCDCRFYCLAKTIDEKLGDEIPDTAANWFDEGWRKWVSLYNTAKESPQ